jgi:hypothetical protein
LGERLSFERFGAADAQKDAVAGGGPMGSEGSSHVAGSNDGYIHLGSKLRILKETASLHTGKCHTHFWESMH